MITYFVSFSGSKEGNHATGNVCIYRDREIDSEEDIKEIEEAIIKECSADSVIIINFIKMKG